MSRSADTAEIASRIARYARALGFEVDRDHATRTESAYIRCWTQEPFRLLRIRVSCHPANRRTRVDVEVRPGERAGSATCWMAAVHRLALYVKKDAADIPLPDGELSAMHAQLVRGIRFHEATRAAANRLSAA